jgi:hypothetical protein
MRTSTALACSMLLGVLFSVNALSASKQQPEFDRIKSLAGNWAGTMTGGKSVHISYKVISSGSAVMESMDHDGMVTMYHLDGDTLMLTHYCSAGNQPRMRLVSSTPGSLTFDMFDATNLSDVNDMHMAGLVLTWKDKNHLTADWTLMKDGKVAHHGVFELTRRK